MSTEPILKTQSTNDQLLEQSLPQDRKDFCRGDSSWMTVNIPLKSELIDKIKSSCRDDGYPSPEILVGAFFALLFHYIREEEVAIGWIRHNRGQFEATKESPERLLSVKISDRSSFTELLEQIREQVDLDGSIVDGDLLKRHHRFPVLIRTNVDESDSNQSRSLYDQSELLPDGCELLLDAIDVTESGLLRVGFNAKRFRVEFITDLIGQYQLSLHSALLDLSMNINALSMVSPEEEFRLLKWGNVNQDKEPRVLDYYGFFLHHVSQTPDKVAVKYQGGFLSYKELDHRIRKQAICLQEYGVTKGDAVGVCLPNSPELVITAYAILAVRGAVFLLDSELPVPRQVQLLDMVAPTVVVGSQECHMRLVSEKWKVIQPREAQDDSDSFRDFQPMEACREDVAFLLPTSGSSGAPKIVIEPLGYTFVGIPDRGGDYLLKNRSGTAFMRSELIRPIISGGTLNIPSSCIHTDLLGLVKYINLNRISELLSTPSMLRGIMNTGIKCNSLRLIDCIGEAISLQDMERFRSYFKIPIRYSYGCTEATGSTFVTCSPDATCHVIAHMGRANPNRRVYVLDLTMKLCPVGMPGEIYVGGSISLGYLNSASETKERYLQDPFEASSEAKMFRTGDRGRWVGDGNLEVLGRTDDQFKLRGFRIEPNEIESAINEHPEVVNSAILLREDRLGDQQLVAYLEYKSEFEKRSSTLRDYLKGRLPAHMIPTVYVKRETLPMTLNGKVDRKALPAPTEADRRGGIDFTAPRTPIEEILTLIWNDVLGIKRVSIHDNFFDLGGHSLLAIRLISKIRKEFDIELPLRVLFECPTIELLGSAILEIELSDLEATN
jgi:acyl-coenzyme A synthetase/AMP-(fatty) acid ligase/acyl carrier protein